MLTGSTGFAQTTLAAALMPVLLLACSATETRAQAASRPDRRTARPATSAPDLTAELTELKGTWLKAVGRGHAAAIRSPFLVIIDRDEDAARQWLTETVFGSTRRFQKQYMDAQPDKPMVVLLFSGQKNYRRFCIDVLHDTDPPYYGFFRPTDRVLVMDINTGGGTLVHELTHAMIAFDFPNIPAWFNEGMGSLYEQCSYQGDRIVGLPNWRLPALQKAIEANKLGSLEDLTSTDFRGANMGMNYAQARYLCHYMQDKGMLEKYYRAFRDHAADDPTGLKTLKEAFAPKTLADVDMEWRKWVLTLRFPPR
ncbi:MAG: hypothetical protein PHU85_14715 [Phycisphaerae bacterium]|nr:hypothetical protein [Phycisphaerae bacterium]